MTITVFQDDVAVIGAGTMGIGIAEVAAEAGHQVYLFDVTSDATQKALESLRQRLMKRAEAGKIRHEYVDTLLARIHPVRALQALSDCTLIIEAIAEKLDIKQSLWRDLEAICAKNTLFASNTSSLSITAIASTLRFPARFAGLHFFNPAPVMKLVEIVKGLETSAETVDRLKAIAAFWGKHAVCCQSTPGFIVNRIARPFYAETLRALEEQVASPATLDAVLRDAGGFAMGALQLTDLIGQDINYSVTESVFQAFYFDPRFQPSLVQRERVMAGHLGRKSGRGFYDYVSGSSDANAAFSPESGVLPEKINVHGNWSCLPELARLLGTYPGCQFQSPSEGEPWVDVDGIILMLSEGKTAAQLAKEKRAPVVLFDLSADYVKAGAVAISAAERNTSVQTGAVIGLFQSLGKRVIVLPDYPGLITLRTVAMLCNEALDAVNKNVASATDIETAMRYGVNYPLGPLSWGARLGWSRLLQLLENLQAFYGESRYRPMPLLRQLANGEAVLSLPVSGEHKHE